MVIVSQDRRVIVNFENIKTIELDRETNFTSINIFRETNQVETGVCGLFIGSYKTEERAKEVLQEIIEEYTSSNSGFGSQGYVKNKVFYMPGNKED